MGHVQTIEGCQMSENSNGANLIFLTVFGKENTNYQRYLLSANCGLYMKCLFLIFLQSSPVQSGHFYVTYKVQGLQA